MAPDEILPPQMLPLFHTLDQLDKMESPRIIKTHLPFYLLPPNLLDTCKVVYVARNPKDVIVSYYHHHQIINFQRFEGTLEQFTEFFLNDQGIFKTEIPPKMSLNFNSTQKFTTVPSFRTFWTPGISATIPICILNSTKI